MVAFDGVSVRTACEEDRECAFEGQTGWSRFVSKNESKDEIKVEKKKLEDEEVLVVWRRWGRSKSKRNKKEKRTLIICFSNEFENNRSLFEGEKEEELICFCKADFESN